jgi:hypothetical protein
MYKIKPIGTHVILLTKTHKLTNTYYFTAEASITFLMPHGVSILVMVTSVPRPSELKKKPAP